jgi:PQQ-like domain
LAPARLRSRPDELQPVNFTIAARDEGTGAVRWSFAIRQVVDARFMGIGNGLAYVRVGSVTGDGATDTSDLVLALDAMTGQLRWFLQAPDPSNFQDKLVTIRSFLLDGPRLFLVTSAPGSGYFVSAYDTAGHSIWSASALGTLDSIVADPGRTLHAVSFVQLNPDGTGTNVLTSYAESSGVVSAQRLADFAPHGAVISTPMSFANGVIYANSSNGTHVDAVAVRVSDGVQLWNALDESVEAVTPGAVITLDSGHGPQPTDRGAPLEPSRRHVRRHADRGGGGRRGVREPTRRCLRVPALRRHSAQQRAQHFADHRRRRSGGRRQHRLGSAGADTRRLIGGSRTHGGRHHGRRWTHSSRLTRSAASPRLRRHGQDADRSRRDRCGDRAGRL